MGSRSAASTNSNWAMHAWQSDDGLPNNNVTSLTQTPDGYLWAANPTALARFDGIRFEKFSPALLGADPNERFRIVITSRAGGLWLALDRGGIVYTDGRRTQMYTNGLPDLPCNALLEDDEGALWSTYSLGVVCRVKRNGEAVHFTERDGMPDAPTCSLAKDNKGQIWFAKSGQTGVKTAQVGIYRNGHFEGLFSFGKSAVRLAASRIGGVWICNGSQLLRSTENGPPEETGDFSPGRKLTPTALLEDGHGAVWIGTSDSGVFRFDGSKFDHIETSHPQISSLFEDRQGNIWVGTLGGGIDRIRRRGVELQGQEQGLPFQSVRSLTLDTNGVLWASTENGRLARYQNGAWSAITTNENWLGGFVTCVAADSEGGVWIGTQNRVLYYLKNGQFTIFAGTSRPAASLEEQTGANSRSATNRLVSRLIRGLLVSRRGDVWIAGEGPLILHRLRDGDFKNFPITPAARSIRAMAEDNAGEIWLGTSAGYLLRANDETIVDETARTTGEPISIRALCTTADGALCIGYAGYGLGYLKKGHFTRITSAQGLFDDYVSQIVPDGRGGLWFGGDRGIFKVQQQDLDDFAEGRSSRIRSTHYGRDEGLFSLQANFDASPGGLRSRDGRVWIPMRSALAVINPDALRETAEPPPVLLRGVTVDDQVIATYGGALPAAQGADLQPSQNALKFPPTHRRVEFDFTALNLSAPENVHFRYRLDGFDENWIETSETANPRKASYPRLPAGTYRFHVAACNSDGVWSEKDSQFAFIVTPFFWQTWWFNSAVVTAFTLLIIAVVRYASFRRLRLKLHLLEQQAALDKERARIARDLHDDLGSSLTQASLLLDMTQNSLATPNRAMDGMKQCSALVRQVANSVDEIIWAINPRNDTAPYLVDYLSQFVVEFLHAAGVQCRVELPNHVPRKIVSPEVRHNLFMAVKEALNNTARHAGATEVRLKVGADNGQLDIVIEDNGRGFDRPPDNATADGLRNMRHRMEEIGGRFQIESKPETGTRVSFVYPWPRKG